MLSEISIAKQASYPDVPQKLSGLKAVNFIFGANGSGKTTISRVIQDETKPDCQVIWQNARPLERLVYNSDFARDNFAQQMAGIFTLGKAEADVLTKIADLKAKHASISDDITRNEGTLGPEDKSSGKRGDLRKLRAELEENCWVYRGRHDVHFKNGMTGSRGNKAAFCDKLLSELSTNTAALVSLDDLKTRALTVFEEGLEKLPSVSRFAARCSHGCTMARTTHMAICIWRSLNLRCTGIFRSSAAYSR